MRSEIRGVLIRGLRSQDVKNGKISKHVFKPRANGKDCHGISFTLPLLETRAELAHRMGWTPEALCQIESSAVLEIEHASKTLSVEPDPTERDPYHTLVVGIPAACPDKLELSDDQKLSQERFAQLLAQAASQYTPPA
jgi:hypothetical protein